jgi:hypothetical protein
MQLAVARSHLWTLPLKEGLTPAVKNVHSSEHAATDLTMPGWALTEWYTKPFTFDAEGEKERA